MPQASAAVRPAPAGEADGDGGWAPSSRATITEPTAGPRGGRELDREGAGFPGARTKSIPPPTAPWIAKECAGGAIEASIGGVPGRPLLRTTTRRVRCDRFTRPKALGRGPHDELPLGGGQGAP